MWPNMESQAAPLPEVQTHKLFAPRQHAGTIPRTAILERIFADEQRRVALLQGPAGHGKTTTLQQLKWESERRGCLTSWLTFDEADNDARRGFIHIYATILSLGAAPGQPTGEPRHRQRSDWMIEHLRRLERPVVLFFDEFQTLHEKPLLSFFRGLLERVPDNVRIFIGSRSMPAVGLSRLVVGNQALLLSADDLRFSPAEIARFFAGSAELAVSEAELSAIGTRTEGWPAALQLFRLALASPDVRRSLAMLETYRPRELTDYLVENVLSLQPAPVQDFLLRTALLHRLCAPLCDAVTGRNDSQEMLQLLERSGLFLRALDGEMRWFRYHGLFSSFLADHQRAVAPATAQGVHRQAARWHRANGLLEEAVHHFAECGDFSAAADAMDDWASTLTPEGLLMTVERGYDRLPFEQVCLRPGMMIKMAYALLFLRRRHKLAPLLARLRADGAGAADARLVLAMAAICADDVAGAHAIIGPMRLEGHDPTAFAAFELGAGANLAAYCELAVGEFERAHEYLALARCYNDRGQASFSDGYTWGMLGIAKLLQGQLVAALEQFQLGLARHAMHLDGSFASAALVACSIWAHYEANQLDQVEALFAQYRDGIADAVLLDFLAVAYLPMARTHDARGRPARAEEVLDEAEAIGHANGWDRLVRMVQWERSRRFLVASDTDRAMALAARIAPPADWHVRGWRVFSEDLGGETLARIRAAVHGGAPDAAARMLAAEFARHRDRVSLKIRLHVLDAVLQRRRGAQNAAQRSLRRALALAQQGGFVRPFLDEGEGVLQLLREAYQAIMNQPGDAPAGAERGFVERILQAAGTDLTRPRGAVVAAPLEALTEREMAILAILASGGSNRDIGERLAVSENTVKFHLKNVYAKLAVANRLQAIIAAQHLGLTQSAALQNCSSPR